MAEEVKCIAHETLEEWVARVEHETDEGFAEFGETREHCLAHAKLCAEVRDTIRMEELQLLLYLRHCPTGEFFRFYKAAQLNYEAFCSTLSLFPFNRHARVEN